MKRLLISAWLMSLICVPSLAQAGVARDTTPAVVEAVPSVGPVKLAPLAPTPVTTRDFAAREAAAPQLADFAGGGNGIYIGSGALVVGILVVILILVLR